MNDVSSHNKRLEPTRLAASVYSYASGRAAQAQRSRGQTMALFISHLFSLQAG